MQIQHGCCCTTHYTEAIKRHLNCLSNVKHAAESICFIKSALYCTKITKHCFLFLLSSTSGHSCWYHQYLLTIYTVKSLYTVIANLSLLRNQMITVRKGVHFYTNPMGGNKQSMLSYSLAQ